MNTNRHPLAPEPRPFAFRRWNRSECLSLEEISILNMVANRLLETAVSKMEGALEGRDDLTADQRHEIYRTLAVEVTNGIPQAFAPFMRAAGATVKV